MIDQPSAVDSSSVTRLERQLHAFKIIVFILLGAFLIVVAAFLYKQKLGDPETLFINDKAIATVQSPAVANQVIARAEQSGLPPGFPPTSAVRIQKVQLRPAMPGTPVDSDSDAVAKLHAALTIRIRAYVIMVKGLQSLGLPTNKEAVETLNLVKQHFVNLPPAADVVGEPEFLESVVIKNSSVNIDKARSTAAEAAPYFWTPPPARTATVKRGDTGSRIARRNHISLTDFLAANSGMNVNKIKPGDIVNVQKMPLLLAVRVKKKLSQNEKIVANAPDSEAGQRHITYEVTYINGQEMRRDVLDMVTLSKPRTRISL